MKILCKIFDHNFKYYKSSLETPSRNLRCCRNCGKLQEYRTIVFPFDTQKDWITLTERTKRGAQTFLETINPTHGN